MKHKI
jgi:chromosome segregation ATPase